MTTLLMRSALFILSGFALATLPAEAQESYPSQAIRFIVPYAAGGFPDTVARVVGARLQERIGRPVVVENRPGGAGSVAVNALLSAPADGYTLLVTDGTIVTANPRLFKQHPYSEKDLAPVVLLARSPLFLAVHETVPATTLKEFVEHVRARPGQIAYGSSGVGSAHHLSMEAMNAALELKMTHVPYRGTGQSVPALLGGHVSVLFSALPSLSGAVQSKTVKLLAHNGTKRSPQAPDVVPLGDVIPGYDLATMVGVFARVGTSPAIMKKIAEEAAVIVKMPETLKQFAAGGLEASGEDADAFAKALAVEAGHVTKVIQTAGIKAQ